MRDDIMAQAENDRRIVYIELGVADVERSKAFYGKAFAWTFTDYGPTYCEFSDGRLHGGFTTATPPRPGGPLVILYAVDLVAVAVGERHHPSHHVVGRPHLDGDGADP